MFKPSPKSAEVAHSAAHGGGPFGSGLGEDRLQRIGNTPLVQFETLTGERPNVQILGKAAFWPCGMPRPQTGEQRRQPL